MRKIKLIGLTAIVWGVSTSAFAVADGFYMGVQGGATDTHQKTRQVQTMPQPPGTPQTSPPATVPATPSKSGFGGRIFMGAQMNKYSAAEFGITSYGATTYSASGAELYGTPSYRQQSIDIVGKGILPLGPLNVFAKLGVAYVTGSLSGSLVQPVPPGGSAKSVNGARPIAAVGVGYDLSQNWVADVSWSRIISGGGSVQPADFIALGISYHFVDKYCGQFLC